MASAHKIIQFNLNVFYEYIQAKHTYTLEIICERNFLLCLPFPFYFKQFFSSVKAAGSSRMYILLTLISCLDYVHIMSPK